MQCAKNRSGTNFVPLGGGKKSVCKNEWDKFCPKRNAFRYDCNAFCYACNIKSTNAANNAVYVCNNGVYVCNNSVYVCNNGVYVCNNSVYVCNNGVYVCNNSVYVSVCMALYRLVSVVMVSSITKSGLLFLLSVVMVWPLLGLPCGSLCNRRGLLVLAAGGCLFLLVLPCGNRRRSAPARITTAPTKAKAPNLPCGGKLGACLLDMLLTECY